MTDRERKNQLFARGAEALRRISNQAGFTYACPTCRRLMTRDDLTRGDLTLEHVPPQALGGRGMVLTCRDCNSTAGHTVDAAVHQRARFFSLGSLVSGRGGEFKGTVSLDIAGLTTNARLRFKGRNADFEIQERDNHPERFKAQTEALKAVSQPQRPEDFRFKVTARIPMNFEIARVSDLRTAFLAAFAQFGYGYALHPQLDAIRSQILNPGSQFVTGAWWIAGPGFPEDPMMMVLHDPIPALLVRLGHVLVVLPWLGSGADFYSQVRSALGTGPKTVTGDVIAWPQSLEMVFEFPESE